MLEQNVYRYTQGNAECLSEICVTVDVAKDMFAV